jgi:uncharacterized membrane protein YkvA (DUF1232 family)
VSTALAAPAFLPWGMAIIVAGLYALGVLLLALAGRRTDARALAGFGPDCAVLMRRLAAHPDTPRGERWLLAALVVYLVSPVDVIPDFLPGVGHLDDAVLVILALRRLVRIHGADRIRDAWPGPERSLRVVLHAAGVPGATTLSA